MTKTPTVAGALRAAILNPLAGWRHEFVPMPEWGDVTAAVRRAGVPPTRIFGSSRCASLPALSRATTIAGAREKYERVRPD
ncbi:gp13 phage protein [Burkholderia cenocepacia PC184]|nr:gp13 phage protein [Burkholderia cenocepacia PC184]